MDPICNADWPFPWDAARGIAPHCGLQEGHQDQHLSTDNRYSWATAADGTLNEASLKSKSGISKLGVGPSTEPIQLRPIDFPQVSPLLAEASRPGAFDSESPKKPFQFDERTLKESLDTKIGVAIGAASMAWENFRAGTFDSTYAATITEAVMAEIEKEGATLKLTPREAQQLEDALEDDGFNSRVAQERLRQKIKGYDLEHDRKHGIRHVLNLAYRYAAVGDRVRAAALIEAAADLTKDVEPTEGTTEEDVTTTKASLPTGYNRREAVEIAIRISSSEGTSAENLIASAQKIEAHLSGDKPDQFPGVTQRVLQETTSELVQAKAKIAAQEINLREANERVAELEAVVESKRRAQRESAEAVLSVVSHHYASGWQDAVNRLNQWPGSRKRFIEQSPSMLKNRLESSYPSVD